MLYHRLGILDRKMSQSAACSWENLDTKSIHSTSFSNTKATHDPLARLDGAPFACCVGRNSSAHDGTGLFVLHSLWDSSGIPPVADGVFLEGASRAKARVLLMGAMKFIDAVGAEFTLAASTPHPLEDVVSLEGPWRVDAIS